MERHTSAPKHVTHFFKAAERGADLVAPEVHQYIEEFLTAQHPARKGAVCPFVPPALARGDIRYSEVIEQGKATIAVREACEYYLSERMHNGAVIIQLDGEDMRGLAPQMEELKKIAFDHGLLLGLFDRDNKGVSMHDERFHPFMSPKPILVVRNLHSSDIPLVPLRGYKIDNRIRFLEAYVKTFRSSQLDVVKERVQSAERKLARLRLRKRLIGA